MNYSLRTFKLGKLTLNIYVMEQSVSKYLV